MKSVIAFFLFCLATVAVADVQVNQQKAYAHAPIDVEDADNELFVQGIVTLGSQYNGGMSVRVQEIRTDYCTHLPPPVNALNQGDTLLIADADMPGEACTITDVNGTARTADAWQSRVLMRLRGQYGLCEVETKLWCWQY